MSLQHHIAESPRRPILLPSAQSGGDQEDPPAPAGAPKRVVLLVVPPWLGIALIVAACLPYLAFVVLIGYLTR